MLGQTTVFMTWVVTETETETEVQITSLYNSSSIPFSDLLNLTFFYLATVKLPRPLIMKPPSNEALDGLSIPKKIAPSLSFLTTLYYRTAVFALQKIVIRPILFVQWLLAYIKPPAVRPDLVKTYGSHRHLPIRSVVLFLLDLCIIAHSFAKHLLPQIL